MLLFLQSSTPVSAYVSMRAAQLLSHVQFFAAPWTVACQAPQDMGFSRQEEWIGLPFPPAGHLPHPGIELGFPAGFFTIEPAGRPYLHEAFSYFFFSSKNYIFSCTFIYICCTFDTFIRVCIHRHICVHIYTSILHICIFELLPLSHLQCAYQCFLPSYLTLNNLRAYFPLYLCVHTCLV